MPESSRRVDEILPNVRWEAGRRNAIIGERLYGGREKGLPCQNQFARSFNGIKGPQRGILEVGVVKECVIHWEISWWDMGAARRNGELRPIDSLCSNPWRQSAQVILASTVSAIRFFIAISSSISRRARCFTVGVFTWAGRSLPHRCCGLRKLCLPVSPCPLFRLTPATAAISVLSTKSLKLKVVTIEKRYCDKRASHAHHLENQVATHTRPNTD